MTETLPAVAVQQKLATVRAMLDRMRPQMLMVIGDPAHVSVIARVAMTAIQRNPMLLDCTPTSLMGAIMQATQLGLEPDDVRGLAFLVPFREHGVMKCQLIPGYKGLLHLAKQTEGVHDIYAQLVYEKDEFEYAQGADPLLRHVPFHGKDRGKVRAGYYMIVFANGFKRFHVMWDHEFEDVKKKALANKKNKDNPALPWNAYEDEMDRKTLLRRASGTLPQNSRLATASHLSALGDAGIAQNLDLLVDPNAVAPAEESDERTSTPARAPRKGKDAGGSAKPVSSASPPGESGTATQAPPHPNTQGDLLSKTDISKATLEALVEKMSELDRWQGEKVAFKILAERYPAKERVGQLTEADAQDYIKWIDLQTGGEPA